MKRKTFKAGRRGPVGMGIAEREFSSPQSMGAALGQQARNAPVPGYREGGKVRERIADDRIPERQMSTDRINKRYGDTKIPNAYQGELEPSTLPDVGDTYFSKRETRLADGGMVRGYPGGRHPRRYVEGGSVGNDKDMSAGAQARFRQQCKGK